MPEYPAIAELLPHADPMVLIDRLVDWTPEGATCQMVVRPNTRFVEGDRLPTPYLLEHMAQSVAACLGYEAFRGGRGPRVGMIISCRSFVAHEDATPVGDELRLEARREMGSEALSRFRCQSRRGDVLVAEATMTLFHGAAIDEGGGDARGRGASGSGPDSTGTAAV